MPTFAYVVKDKAGKTYSGTLEPETRNNLIEQLWKQEFVIISIDERQAGRSQVLKIGQPGVKAYQLVIFSRQLATMVDSGIPIVSALDVLADQIEDRNFKQILKKMRDDVEAGTSLSEATGRHPERPHWIAGLEGLEDRPKRFTVVPADVDMVKDYVTRHCQD